MIYFQPSFSILLPSREEKISFKGIETDPKLKLVKKQTISNAIRTKKVSLYVLNDANYYSCLKNVGS